MDSNPVFSSLFVRPTIVVHQTAGPESLVDREELVCFEFHVLHNRPCPEDHHLQGIAKQVSLARSHKMGREKTQENRGTKRPDVIYIVHKIT